MADNPTNNPTNNVPEPDDSLPEESANGLRGFEILGEFFERDGWHPQLLGDDNYVYRMFFAGENGELACFAQVRVDLEQFIFYVVLPVRVPEDMRANAAEYLTRANYGLRIGNFELDYSDGEIRYKSSIDFEGVTLNDHLIRGVVYPAVQTMDRYAPGIMAVIYGGKSPEDAIEEIES